MKRIGVALLVGLVGCSSEPAPSEVVLAEARTMIKDGMEDTTSKAVVAITNSAGGLCTGSLIAPNVVLTARHCVSPTNPSNASVICDTTTFGPPFDAGAFFVTTADEVTTGTLLEYFVDEVVLLPVETTALCGHDAAILILADNVPEEDATPYLPRLADDPLLAGELFDAVGYGGTDNGGNGAGTRRRRSGLEVTCVGNGCQDVTVFGNEITGTEWAANGGVCQGDSGGPALDEDNRVFGITSRGDEPCENSIYAYTASWEDWLKDTVVYASGMGVYTAPSWTEGSTVNPEHSMPVGEPCSSDDQCPSGKCLLDAEGGTCTRICDPAHPCPTEFVCEETESFGQVCAEAEPPPPATSQSFERADRGGCAMAPASGERGWGLAWLAGLMVMARRRRERA